MGWPRLRCLPVCSTYRTDAWVESICIEGCGPRLAEGQNVNRSLHSLLICICCPHKLLLCSGSIGDEGELAQNRSPSDIGVLALSAGIQESTQSKDKTLEKGAKHRCVKNLRSTAAKSYCYTAPENVQNKALKNLLNTPKNY